MRYALPGSQGPLEGPAAPVAGGSRSEDAPIG